MYALERHFLGLLVIAEKCYIYRFPVRRGFNYDLGWALNCQSIYVEHVSALHAVPADHPSVDILNFHCGFAYEEESV